MRAILSKWKFLALAGGIPFFTSPLAQAQTQTTIQLKLTSNSTTSAGVYRPNGSLIRNLWQKVDYTPGTYQIMWDGLDNDGKPVPVNTYQIKVIAHKVSYVWEGVVGNTSASWTNNVWRSLVVMQDFCMAPSGESYAGVGYNEGLPGLVYSPAGTVQAPHSVKEHDFYDAFSLVRADNTYLYAVTNNSGWDNKQTSFVMRFKQSDKTEAPWSAGATTTYGPHGPARTRYGVVGLRQSATTTEPQRPAWLANRITGLAVNSSYVAVARKAQNSVQFYAVGTGALLGSLSVNSPGQIAFASTGDLWVVSAGQVKRYTVNSGNSFTAQNTLPGIVNALALDAHPTQNLLLVADGNTSQQVKAYDAAGTLQWTYGQAGGYPSLGPEVVNDKFWFQIQDPLAGGATDRDQYGDPFTFVKWQPDGTFWILDTANLRAMHFGADRRYLGQIMYLPDRLAIAGDQNNATRIFSGNLEFKVSTAPLQPGDQSIVAAPSWQLVRNWSAGLDITRYGSVVNVTTHPNGHTYAQMQDNSITSGPNMTQLVELPATGKLRFTGTLVEDYGNGGFSYEQMADGNLRCARINYAGAPTPFDFGGKAIITGERRALTGYDSNFNPQYGPIQVLWKVASGLKRGDDPFPSKPIGARTRLPQTQNGNYVTYQSTRTGSQGFHLGTIAPGDTTWTAKFHRGKVISSPDRKGSYPEIEAYGGWDGANAYADQKDIVALYNGQNNTTSNTFYHFTQDGLLVNEFGVPADDKVGLTDNYAPAGFAGNNVDMYMVRPSANTLHVYTVDEAVHAGLHRWRVDGSNSIQELTGSGQLGKTILVGAGPLPVNLLSFSATRNGTQVSCNWETASEQNSDYFIVERSADGTDYAPIGKVASAGSSASKRSYYYADANPLTSLAYYRLRLVDTDGSESFSPVMTVATTNKLGAALVASVVPNPGNDFFELLTSGSPIVEANIYNTLGGHLQRLVPSSPQTQRLNFNLANYPAGIYVVRVQMAAGLKTVKLLKN
ncbi:T9SS type A sorting domain-containing protein [Hymenobacter bucti]|uniref:T9SS type A sorting domain-containing protein n=1 Tax=Hymenobacter bucti TaxID=1844114 RepID=A0ABW4QPS3_9BACT